MGMFSHVDDEARVTISFKADKVLKDREGAIQKRLGDINPKLMFNVSDQLRDAYEKILSKAERELGKIEKDASSGPVSGRSGYTEPSLGADNA